MTRRFGAVGHLVRRTLGSISQAQPPIADLDWVRAQLTPAEWALWQRFGPADRRHTIVVTRRTLELLDAPVPSAVVAGALLHDIGKVSSHLGVPARVAATVWRWVRGPAAATTRGRMGDYLRHEPIGAALCRDAGSDPVTIALVGRSLPETDVHLAALTAADDSI